MGVVTFRYYCVLTIPTGPAMTPVLPRGAAGQQTQPPLPPLSFHPSSNFCCVCVSAYARERERCGVRVYEICGRVRICMHPHTRAYWYWRMHTNVCACVHQNRNTEKKKSRGKKGENKKKGCRVCVEGEKQTVQGRVRAVYRKHCRKR